MQKLIEIFNELKSTSSRKEKERIISENKDNQLFRDILYFVFNPYIVTGISKKKFSKKIFKPLVDPIKNVNEMMKYLQTHNSGTDHNVASVKYFISGFIGEEVDFLTSIAIKDLKLGIDSKTINKALGELFIPTFDVMLAKKYDDHEHKVTGEFILTTKLDGIRCVAIKKPDGISLFSRQGQPIEGMDDIVEEIKMLPDGVYDGELLLRNDHNLNSGDLYRATTKVVREDGIKKNVEYLLFDYLLVDDFYKGVSNIPCYERKANLHILLSENVFIWLKEVPMLYIGDNKEKILQVLEEEVANDKEGIMLNIANAPYECKRSDKILKIKKFHDADLLVTQVIEGTGKNVGKLGAITVRFIHEGKEYECNCGSGFSDDERIKYWQSPEMLLGKICTIGYFEISKNQNGGFGLRFPTWKGIIRDDKTEISMF